MIHFGVSFFLKIGGRLEGNSQRVVADFHDENAVSVKVEFKCSRLDNRLRNGLSENSQHAYRSFHGSFDDEFSFRRIKFNAVGVSRIVQASQLLFGSGLSPLIATLGFCRNRCRRDKQNCK